MLTLEISQKQKNVRFILTSLVFSSISMGLYGTILPLYVDYINIPLASMGFIFALSPMFSSFTQFFISSLSDRFGRKILLLFSHISSAFTGGLIPLARNITSLFTLRIFRSICSFSGPIVSSLIFENSEGTDRVKLLSLVRSITMPGMALAMFVSGFLLMNLGFSFMFMIVALMQVISFLLVFQIKEAYFKKEKVKTFRENISAVFSVRGLNIDVYRISFSWFFRSLGSSFGEGFILILFLSKILHAQPSIIGLTRAGAYILYAVPSLLFSNFVLRWMKAWSNRKVYVIAFLLSSFFMFLIGCAIDPLQVTLFYAILGIIEGFSIIPQMTFFSTSSKELIGKSFGISTLIRSLGSLLGGMVAPVLASKYGFRPMFTISAIFQIITILPIIVKKPIDNKP